MQKQITILIWLIAALLGCMIFLGAMNADTQTERTKQICIANGGTFQDDGCSISPTTDRLTDTVRVVCDYTRIGAGGMDLCQRAQAVSNTEYLCKNNNTSADNVCWVEVR